MLTFLCCAFFYFLPSVCAFSRNHNSRAAILVFNFLLGWTVIGWIIALIWSLNSNVERPQVIYYAPLPPGTHR